LQQANRVYKVIWINKWVIGGDFGKEDIQPVGVYKKWSARVFEEGVNIYWLDIEG